MSTVYFFEYDDRYFENTKHTREELYKLQSLIMTVKSSDIGKEIESLGIYEKKEIDVCLRKYFAKNKINRERIRIQRDIPIYRYFT